jgi:hypothetical protein
MVLAHQLDDSHAPAVSGRPVSPGQDRGVLLFATSSICRPSRSRIGLLGRLAHVLPCEVQTGTSAIVSPFGSRTQAKPIRLPLRIGLNVSSCMRGRSTTSVIAAPATVKIARQCEDCAGSVFSAVILGLLK